VAEFNTMEQRRNCGKHTTRRAIRRTSTTHRISIIHPIPSNSFIQNLLRDRDASASSWITTPTAGPTYFMYQICEAGSESWRTSDGPRTCPVYESSRDSKEFAFASQHFLRLTQAEGRLPADTVVTQVDVIEYKEGASVLRNNEKLKEEYVVAYRSTPT
jgi:hypothetical protein